MQQYLDVVRTVLTEGQWKMPPHGIRRLSVPGLTMRFDLDEGFPLITTRDVRGSWKAMRAELLWLLSGSTDANELAERFGIKLWKQWATKEICSAFGRPEGQLGPLYGHQWRNFGATVKKTTATGHTLEYNQDGFDQIAYMIKLLKTNPDSSRIRVSAWNPRDVWKEPVEDFNENVFITPCHGTFQIFHAQGELTLILTQNSADVPVGVPFNIAEYALLLKMIAHVVGMKAKCLVHVLNDAQIYEDQIDNMKELLGREPLSLPQVNIVRDVKDIFSFAPDDFELVGYNARPKMNIPVAV
ncbi:MAG: thymidylate synthase [Parcubacteria group bacterium]|nr:thymidylate synthase [Parcubacteria group bacterium]